INFFHAVKSALNIYQPQMEGNVDWVQMSLRGEVIVRPGAPESQLFADFQEIACIRLQKDLTFIFRNVERPVIVFKGNWNFSPQNRRLRGTSRRPRGMNAEEGFAAWRAGVFVTLEIR